MNKLKSICWPVTLFLFLNPLISSLLLSWTLWINGLPDFKTCVILAVFTLIFAILTNLSITMGYHRLYAHKSYEAHPLLEAFLLLVSAGAFQGSALKWASDHRLHHKYEDTERDPYSINKGFWYAHMGWMMKHDSVSLPIRAPDLEKNKLIMIQHQGYLFWSIFVGYIIPLIVGFVIGHPLLVLAVAGGLRIFLTQQSTFLVNSLSHTLGRATYSLHKTAKDSWLVAFLTHGEGFHNFHHKFQFDYRNGIRWYHWDPTKWSIEFARLLGLAKNLKTVKFSEILRARLQVELEKIRVPDQIQNKLTELQSKIVQTQSRIEELKTHYKAQGKQRAQHLRAEITVAQFELRLYLKQWRFQLRHLHFYTSRLQLSVIDSR